MHAQSLVRTIKADNLSRGVIGLFPGAFWSIKQHLDVMPAIVNSANLLRRNLLWVSPFNQNKCTRRKRGDSTILQEEACEVPWASCLNRRRQ